MERISVNRFSFRRKRSHKRDKEKEDNSHNGESTDNDLPKMKYIRYVIQAFIVAKCNEGFLSFIFARPGLRIYGGLGSLSCDFIKKIWPIIFKGSGPSGPILFSCVKRDLTLKNIHVTASLRTP